MAHKEAISVLPGSHLAATIFGIPSKMQGIKNHTDGLCTNAAHINAIGTSNVSAVGV